jgi:hypothetical protein
MVAGHANHSSEPVRESVPDRADITVAATLCGVGRSGPKVAGEHHARVRGGKALVEHPVGKFRRYCFTEELRWMSRPVKESLAGLEIRSQHESIEFSRKTTDAAKQHRDIHELRSPPRGNAVTDEPVRRSFVKCDAHSRTLLFTQETLLLR